MAVAADQLALHDARQLGQHFTDDLEGEPEHRRSGSASASGSRRRSR